jgi:ABC-type lipoprotein release transport system permease subunit
MLLIIALSLQVSNSLVSKSIDEKTYENAMLRCLGWNQTHVVLIILMKTLYFNVLPGLVLGLYFCGFLV